MEVSALYGLLRFNLGTGERGRRAAPRRRAGTVAGPREPAGSGAMARKWEGVIDRSPMHILDMLGAARSLLSRTTCERLVLKAAIGTGEASSTGISAGLAWEAVGAAMAFARESVGKWRCSPTVTIEPSFLETRVDVDLDCILAVRLGHAIIAVLEAVRRR